MKPCKIKIWEYGVPKGDRDDPWQFWDKYRHLPDEPRYGLLCDSEEHADRVLAALKRLDSHALEGKCHVQD